MGCKCITLPGLSPPLASKLGEVGKAVVGYVSPARNLG